jgi:polyphosphate glucokinase
MEMCNEVPQTLTIDIGGHNVKIRASGGPEVRKTPSGPRLTPVQMIADVRRLAADWSFDRVSIGYPGVVNRGTIIGEPPHLGSGWEGFDFEAAFGCPVRLINDAAMQAVGSYQGEHMLFLGLGTGLGSAMILDGVVQPMEIGRLIYRKGRTYEDFAGANGRKLMGTKAWRIAVLRIIDDLSHALLPDYIVVGGGEVKRFEVLPPNCRRGSNAAAFDGGFKLWEEDSRILPIRDPLRNGS